MGAGGERELTKGVCVGRKPGCPWPSGGGVQIAVPLLSDSAWELGARLSPPEGNHRGTSLFAAWPPLLFPLWALHVKVFGNIVALF